MSPEQVLGNTNEIDVRSDIYSLGVTLYEMLTLRVPFPSDSTAEVSRQILDGRWTPIRELNPTIPRDAQTVVATAMDRDAPRRYRSAAAFARDLGNVLELRPIEARPQTPWVHARRWAQRHPAASVAIVLGSLLVIGGPTAFAVVQNIERAKTTLALEDSEKNLDFALRAVDRLVGRPRRGSLGRAADGGDAAQILGVGAAVLQRPPRALRVAPRGAAAHRHRAGAGRRYPTKTRRVDGGEGLDRGGDLDGAGLAGERPDDSRAAAGLATALDQLGAMQNSSAAPISRKPTFASRSPSARRSSGAIPMIPSRSRDEAYSRDHLGVALRKLGRLADARAAHDRALAILAGLAKRAPKDLEIHRATARAEYNLAECWRFEANYDNLAKAASRALTAIDALRALGPLAPSDREDEAMIRGALGLAYISAGKLDSALDEDRKSLEIRKSLAADFQGRCAFGSTSRRHTTIWGSSWSGSSARTTPWKPFASRRGSTPRSRRNSQLCSLRNLAPSPPPRSWARA